MLGGDGVVLMKLLFKVGGYDMNFEESSERVGIMVPKTKIP